MNPFEEIVSPTKRDKSINGNNTFRMVSQHAVIQYRSDEENTEGRGRGKGGKGISIRESKTDRKRSGRSTADVAKGIERARWE